MMHDESTYIYTSRAIHKTCEIHMFAPLVSVLRSFGMAQIVYELVLTGCSFR